MEKEMHQYYKINRKALSIDLLFLWVVSQNFLLVHFHYPSPLFSKFTLVRRYIPPKENINQSWNESLFTKQVSILKQSLPKCENLTSGRWRIMQEAFVHTVFLQHPKFKTTLSPVPPRPMSPRGPKRRRVVDEVSRRSRFLVGAVFFRSPCHRRGLMF